jgi:hypothetical protein
VFGSTLSENGDAVSSAVGSSNNRIEIAPTGFVSGLSDGIDLDGTNHTVVNNGTVNGLVDSGVELRGGAGGSSSILTNYGSIYGTPKGVSVIGGQNTVFNFGDIAGENRGIEATSANGCKVRNSGTVQGDSGIVVSSAAGTANIIANTGTIIGNYAVFTSAGAETLINVGRILGTVNLGASDDVVRNSGTIDGGIGLLDGNDIYRGRLGGLAGPVDGGIGNDTLIGAGEDDELFGGSGADAIRGGAATTASTAATPRTTSPAAAARTPSCSSPTATATSSPISSAAWTCSTSPRSASPTSRPRSRSQGMSAATRSPRSAATTSSRCSECRQPDRRRHSRVAPAKPAPCRVATPRGPA